jgi:hypothetical protein
MLEIQRRRVDWAVIARFVGFSVGKVLGHCGWFLFDLAPIWFTAIAVFSLGAVFGVLVTNGDVYNLVSTVTEQRQFVWSLTFAFSFAAYCAKKINSILREEDCE